MVFVGRFALRVATSECIKVTQNSQLPALQPNNFFEYADPYTIVWAVSQSDRNAGADLGGRCRGCAPPPPEMTCGFLIQLVFCKKTMWFIGVEVEQETSAPPPKKNPGSAPGMLLNDLNVVPGEI